MLAHFRRPPAAENDLSGTAMSGTGHRDDFQAGAR